MEQYAFFTDRASAGKKLAKKLSHLSGNRPVVLSILNGGIPIGVELAKSFSCPLDVVLVHKLHLINHPEVGFGAISIDGTIELNQDSIKILKLSQAKIEAITENLFEILKKRKEKFTKAKPPENLGFKTVILADDGLSSGYTMLTAVRAIKKKMPKKIIVAVPTASNQGIEIIKNEVDEIVCLYTHPKHLLFEIKNSYQNFPKITDDKVEAIFSDFIKDRYGRFEN